MAKSLHPEYRASIREILSTAPNRWFTEGSIFRAFTRPGFEPNASPADFRKELDWNVTNGFLETEINTELEESVWRLTDKGKRDTGVA